MMIRDDDIERLATGLIRSRRQNSHRLDIGNAAIDGNHQRRRSDRKPSCINGFYAIGEDVDSQVLGDQVARFYATMAPDMGYHVAR